MTWFGPHLKVKCMSISFTYPLLIQWPTFVPAKRMHPNEKMRSSCWSECSDATAARTWLWGQTRVQVPSNDVFGNGLYPMTESWFGSLIEQLAHLNGRSSKLSKWRDSSPQNGAIFPCELVPITKSSLSMSFW